MKNLLHLALLCLTTSALLVLADTPPVIVVTNLDRLTVNGGPPLTYAAALTQHRDLRDALATAVSAYETALIARASAAEVTAQAAQDQLTVNLTNQLEVVTAAETALASQATDAQKVAAFETVVALAKQKRDEREANRREAEAAALRAQAAQKDAEAEALRNNP